MPISSILFHQAGLSAELIEALTGLLTKLSVGKNKYLLKPGQVAQKIFFVQSGAVVLGVSQSSNTYTRHLAGPHDFITCIESLVMQTPSKEFIKATEASEVLVLLKSDFDRLLHKFPELNIVYYKILIHYLLKCQQRVTELLSLDGRAYYEQLLQKQPEILQKLPQYDLASYIGIEPQSLSRIRNRK